MKSWQRTLYILVFVQLMSAVGFSSIFPFLPLYVEELGSQFGLSVELLSGLVFSAQALTMMIAAPIWGALADRHGRKLMVERATLGGAVIILVMGFVTSAEQLVLLRAVQGTITGVVAALMALAAANVPRERMGYALGLLQLGQYAGVAVGPLIGGVAADAFGYQSAFILTSALLALSGILTIWGVEESFTPTRVVTTHGPGFWEAWRHVMKETGVIQAYFARFLNTLGRMIITPFIPLLIQSLMSRESGVATMTGIVTGMSALTGTLSAVYLGRLGDRIGHRRILIWGAVVSMIFILPQAAASQVWQLLLLQALGGFAMGGIMPSISALLATYTEEGEEGAVYGLESSIMAAARAIAPLGGAVIVSLFGLRSVFLAAGLLFLGLTTVSIWVLPHTTPVTLRRARDASPAD